METKYGQKENKKIIKSINVNDYEILTDNGYVDIKYLHETTQYEVFELVLNNGYSLKCADDHIVFDSNLNEIFVKDLMEGDLVITDDGVQVVQQIKNLGYVDNMYDFELSEDSNKRYYANGILSHNTQLVKSLAKYLFGSEDNMIRVDMSEYQQEHEVARMKGCFTPDTEITMSNGKTKKISEINLGDKVLTHLGNNKKVVDMYIYKHEGELDSYKISNRNVLLNCTEQHEILAIKPSIYNKRIDKKSYDINNAKFYNSRDLKEGDILLYPKNIENCESYNKSVIDLADYAKDLPKYKFDDNFVWCFNDIKVNRFIKIDNNFLRLAGYYLSEGVCTKNKKTIKFTFNVNEKNYIEETVNLLKTIFGLDIKIRVKDNLRHSTNIFVTSRIINIALSDLFGRTCYDKKLPDFMMTIDNNMFHNFFETIFYGDGTKTLKRKMVYKTVSKDLTSQLNTLLKKFGYSSQFNEVVHKQKSKIYKIFNTILTGFNIDKMNESLPSLKITNFEIKPKNIQRNQYQDDNYYYYKILKKDKIYYKGPVYDISIEDDSTYISNGVSVHNSPPGYVGYGEGGQLTEKVRRKPYSVILLDEIEKAHKKVYEIFLQVFDDGVMTDGSGRKVDFKNTIIIMTSNVGTKMLGRRNAIGFAAKEEKKDEYNKELIKKELHRQFSPEFLNRLDDVIVFKSLSKESIFKIIDIELSKLKKNLQSKGLTLNLSDNVKNLLMEKGWSETLGARPMKRAIQRYIEDVITMEWLKKSIKDEINMDYNKDTNELTINGKPVDVDEDLNERLITKYSKFRRASKKSIMRRRKITLNDPNDDLIFN